MESNDESLSESQSLDAIDDLMAVPSAEEVQPIYGDLAAEVRKALDDELGIFEWEILGPRLTFGTACGGRFDRLEGRLVSIRSRDLNRPLEGDDWNRAVLAVNAVVEPEGFDDEVPVADQPGSHQVELFGDRGSVVRIYSNTTFGVTIESGCHLKEVDRDAVEQFGVPDPEYWRLLYPDSTAIPTEP